MVELPERDARVSHEGDHRRAGCQTIETIGQIDGVAPGGHEQIDPDHEEHDGHRATCELEAEERLLDEAHTGLRAGEARLGGQDQSQYRVDRGEDELADELALDGQTLALLLAHLGEIVDESEASHRQHGEQHQHRRPRWHLATGEEPVQGGRSPPQHHGEIDHHAAQRRRSALDQMGFRPILTDVLAVIELVHQTNQQWGAHNRHKQRHQNSDDECNHLMLSISVILRFRLCGASSGLICGSCAFHFVPVATILPPGPANVRPTR